MVERPENHGRFAAFESELTQRPRLAAEAMLRPAGGERRLTREKEADLARRI
jgi:hypothetical protein